ncbi:DUF7507 domain-containing protein, partial [Algoriphagus sediminis]|nr:hypothetical protein [Algoriphagus sediminis]
ITDPLTGQNDNVGDLQPGQTATVTTNYAVTQADVNNGQVVNTATATGTDSNQSTQTATASATVTAAQNSGISLTKTANPTTYDQAGDVITYTLIVENIGNVTLTNTTITDPLTSQNDNVGDLQPGQTATITTNYAVTQADVNNGQVVNTAIATGTDPNQSTQSAIASATVTAVQNSGISLTKTANPTTYDQAGDVITYTLIVENTGNVTLTNTTITDPLTGQNDNVGDLQPGQTATVTTNYAV